MISIFIVFLLVCVMAQSTEPSANEPAIEPAAAESQLQEIGKSIAQSSVFAIVTFVVGLVLLIKGYFDSLYEIAEAYPRVVSLCFLIGGFGFALLCSLLAFLVTPQDGITLTKASLLYAGLWLACGPFFVFAPTKLIELKKQSVLRRVVVAARHKATRTATFVLFCVLTAIQALVAFDLYSLLIAIQVEFEQVVLTVTGYVLISLFYLIVFYTAMLGKVFLVNELDLVDHLRSSAMVSFRAQVHLLSTKHYAKLYVTFFSLMLVAQVVAIVFVLRESLVNTTYYSDLSLVQQVLFCVFVGACVLLEITCVVFMLVSAFKPIPMNQSKLLRKPMQIVQRVLNSLHVRYHKSDPIWSHYRADLDPSWRALLEKTSTLMIEDETIEHKHMQYVNEQIGYARLDVHGSCRTVIAARNADQEAFDQVHEIWHATVSPTSTSAHRKQVFQKMTVDFAHPSTWLSMLKAGFTNNEDLDDGSLDLAAPPPPAGPSQNFDNGDHFPPLQIADTQLMPTMPAPPSKAQQSPQSFESQPAPAMNKRTKSSNKRKKAAAAAVPLMSEEFMPMAPPMMRPAPAASAAPAPAKVLQFRMSDSDSEDDDDEIMLKVLQSEVFEAKSAKEEEEEEREEEENSESSSVWDLSLASSSSSSQSSPPIDFSSFVKTLDSETIAPICVQLCKQVQLEHDDKDTFFGCISPKVVQVRSGGNKAAFVVAKMERSMTHGKFAAPECVAGGESNKASDIYSLGVLLSWIFRKSNAELDNCLQEFRDLLDKMTSDDPNDRPKITKVVKIVSKL